LLILLLLLLIPPCVVIGPQSVTSSGAVLLIADIDRPNGIITHYNVFVNSSLVSASSLLFIMHSTYSREHWAYVRFSRPRPIACNENDLILSFVLSLWAIVGAL